jgi:hypothetical protein
LALYLGLSDLSTSCATAGFRNKIDDILANYGDSDLICLQECCHMDTNLVEYLEF